MALLPLRCETCVTEKVKFGQSIVLLTVHETRMPLAASQQLMTEAARRTLADVDAQARIDREGDTAARLPSARQPRTTR